MNYTNAFAISCDWLQLHVKHREDFLDFSPFFRFKRNGQSKVWKDIYDIYDLSGNLIAVYACNGNEMFMPKDHGILKFHNKQLYIHEDLKLFVEKTIKKLGMEFIGITKIDIAFDFQKFYMGLDPKGFILNFLKENYLVMYNRQTENIKFGVFGSRRKKRNEIETLVIGSRYSAVKTRLYNKTRELVNNFKPWINDLHKETFKPTDKEEDIWRLEFSLTSSTAFFKGEGKEINFHSLEILDLKNMYGVFIGLFKNYFRFKRNRGEDRITRMKDIKLWIFDLSFLELRRIARNPMVQPSSRRQKSFIKMLDELNVYCRNRDDIGEEAIWDVKNKAISLFQLQEWCDIRGIEYDKSVYENYVRDMGEWHEANKKKLENDYWENLFIQESKDWIKTF